MGKVGGVIGLYKDGDDKANLLEFLKHSSIKYLSQGGSGTVFILECNDDAPGIYYGFRPNQFGLKIKRIIIKLCVLRDDTKAISYISKFLTDVSQWEFRREYEMQQSIVKSTCNFFEPNAPTILCYDNNFDIGILLTRILIGEHTQQYLEFFLNRRVGLLAMEHIGIDAPYSTLNRDMAMVKRDRKFQLISMHLYEILMHIKHGYIQNDYHVKNSLVCKNTDYFVSDDTSEKWYSGHRTLVIDYGLAKRTGVKDKQLIEKTMAFIYAPDRRDILIDVIDILKNHCYNVDWIYELLTQPDSPIPEYVFELFFARNRAIQRVIKRTRETIAHDFPEIGADINAIKGYLSRDETFLRSRHLLEIQNARKHIREIKNGPLLDFVRKHIQSYTVKNKSLSRLPSWSSSSSSSSSSSDDGSAARAVPITKKAIARPLVTKAPVTLAKSNAAIPSAIKREISGEIRKRVSSSSSSSSDSSGGGGEYIHFLESITSIDLNQLIEESCFGIIAVFYMTGKYEKTDVERSFQTLSLGLDNSHPSDSIIKRQSLPRTLKKESRRKRRSFTHKSRAKANV